MTLHDLIQKLKKFPPEDEFRLYCPINKTYYYFHSTTFIPNTGIICLTDDIYNRPITLIYYGQIISRLEFLCNYLFPNYPITLMHKTQEFIIP